MKRVITTNNEYGRSKVLIEEELSSFGMVWETSPEMPFGHEPGERSSHMEFPIGNTVCRYWQIPPDTKMAEYLKRGIPGQDAQGFHTTDTVDFLVLLEGTLTLILDEGSVDLKSGDIVVQRGTHHAWRNTSDKPARCLAIVTRTAPGVSAPVEA